MKYIYKINDGNIGSESIEASSIPAAIKKIKEVKHSEGIGVRDEDILFITKDNESVNTSSRREPEHPYRILNTLNTTAIIITLINILIIIAKKFLNT